MYRSLAAIIRDVMNGKSELGEDKSEMSAIQTVMKKHRTTLHKANTLSVPRNMPRDADNDGEDEPPEEHNRETRRGMEQARKYQHHVKKVLEDD